MGSPTHLHVMLPEELQPLCNRVEGRGIATRCPIGAQDPESKTVAPRSGFNRVQRALRTTGDRCGGAVAARFGARRDGTHIAARTVAVVIPASSPARAKKRRRRRLSLDVRLTSQGGSE